MRKNRSSVHQPLWNNGRRGKTWKVAKIIKIELREHISRKTSRSIFMDYAILDCGHEKLIPADYQGTYKTMHCRKRHDA